MDESLTLAFEYEAFEALDDPAAAFEDARIWSRYVGVVSQRPGYQVVNELRDLGIYGKDFLSRPRPATRPSGFASEYDTDRYVFVGGCGDATAVGERPDWEFLSVDDAAEKAGWDLLSDGSPTTDSSEE